MLVRKKDNAQIKPKAVLKDDRGVKYTLVSWEVSNNKIVVQGPSGRSYKYPPEDFGLYFT